MKVWWLYVSEPTREGENVDLKNKAMLKMFGLFTLSNVLAALVIGLDLSAVRQNTVLCVIAMVVICLGFGPTMGYAAVAEGAWERFRLKTALRWSLQFAAGLAVLIPVSVVVAQVLYRIAHPS